MESYALNCSTFHTTYCPFETSPHIHFILAGPMVNKLDAAQAAMIGTFKLLQPVSKDHHYIVVLVEAQKGGQAYVLESPAVNGVVATCALPESMTAQALLNGQQVRGAHLKKVFDDASYEKLEPDLQRFMLTKLMQSVPRTIKRKKQQQQDVITAPAAVPPPAAPASDAAAAALRIDPAASAAVTEGSEPGPSAPAQPLTASTSKPAPAWWPADVPHFTAKNTKGREAYTLPQRLALYGALIKQMEQGAAMSALNKWCHWEEEKMSRTPVEMEHMRAVIKNSYSLPNPPGKLTCL